MSDVKVILTDEVRGLGNRGEVVSVAAGYARNFLLPKELAYPATPGNMKRLEQERKRYDVSQAKEKEQAATVAKAFDGLVISVRKKAGEHDALYGSVTASELAEALAAKGIKIDRRRIELEEPIKRLGKHVVHVRLHREVIAELHVEVVAA
jgi:large subunit ribosomal protein L9